MENLKFPVLGVVASILLAAAAPGCSREPAKLTINNGSGVVVSNLFLMGDRTSQDLGSLSPGESKTFEVTQSYPHAWIDFDAAGRKFNFTPKIYFVLSSGHSVTVGIGSDFNMVCPDWKSRQ